MRRPKDAESLAIDILTFLTGISSRDGNHFPILRRAVRTVTNSKRRGLLCVIEEFRKEGSPLAVTAIADHIESFTDYDFAHLLFSDGNIKKSISLEKQLNIIQVADLVLPDKGTSFRGIYDDGAFVCRHAHCHQHLCAGFHPYGQERVQDRGSWMKHGRS